MAYIELSLVLWIANCLIASLLAHLVGWTTALMIVAGFWAVIACLLAVASIVDAPWEMTAKQRLVSFWEDLDKITGLFFGVLAFPLAYAILLFRIRNREAEADAAMKAMRDAAK